MKEGSIEAAAEADSSEEQTVPAKADEEKYKRPDHDLDSIGDLFAELRSCRSVDRGTDR